MTRKAPRNVRRTRRASDAEGVLRTVIMVLLVTAQVALVPLAHIRPPDQTWLAGIYDDADYDDIVLAITGAVGLVQVHPAVLPRPGPSAGVFVCGDTAKAVARLRLASDRAPPLA